MKTFIRLFLPDNRSNYLEHLRSRFLVAISLVGFVVISLYVLLALLFPNPNASNTIRSALLLLGLILLVLAVLRRWGFRSAGNLISIGSVLMVALGVVRIDPSVPLIYKYIQSYYSFFGLLVLNVMFASRWALGINVLLIGAAAFRVQLYAPAQPESLTTLTAGFIHFMVIVFLIGVTIYYANLFSEKVLERLQKQVDLQERQNQKLSTALDLNRSSAAHLNTLAKQLARATEQLSNTAIENAASIEQMSATVEQINDSMSQNAEHANHTEQLVDRTAHFSAQSETDISHTLESVRQVKGQIGLIQEIASKTDMLAINAAIEAARAGASGKGFAVVASEVRKLAERSNKGSVEIKRLIDTSTQLSERTWTNYQNIAHDVQQVEQAVRQISISAKDQQISLEQIGIGLQEINQSAQANAQLAHTLSQSLDALLKHIEELYRQQTQTED